MSEVELPQNGYGAITVGKAHFSWIVRNQEKQQMAILIRSTPENRDSATADMQQIITMMDAAGLEPQMDSHLVRLNRNAPPSVSMSWSGTVNDIAAAEALFTSFTSEIARLRLSP